MVMCKPFSLTVYTSAPLPSGFNGARLMTMTGLTTVGTCLFGSSAVFCGVAVSLTPVAAGDVVKITYPTYSPSDSETFLVKQQNPNSGLHLGNYLSDRFVMRTLLENGLETVLEILKRNFSRHIFVNYSFKVVRAECGWDVSEKKTRLFFTNLLRSKAELSKTGFGCGVRYTFHGD